MQASPEIRPAVFSADVLADGRTAVTVLRERAEVAERRADGAAAMAERALGQLAVVQAKLAEAEGRAGDAECDARAAWDNARAALDAAEAIRRADAARRGRGGRAPAHGGMDQDLVGGAIGRDIVGCWRSLLESQREGANGCSANRHLTDDKRAR